MINCHFLWEYDDKWCIAISYCCSYTCFPYMVTVPTLQPTRVILSHHTDPLVAIPNKPISIVTHHKNNATVQPIPTCLVGIEDTNCYCWGYTNGPTLQPPNHSHVISPKQRLWITTNNTLGEAVDWRQKSCHSHRWSVEHTRYRHKILIHNPDHIVKPTKHKLFRVELWESQLTGTRMNYS